MFNAGMQANGCWDLEVAEAGEYQITLRRWPEELDLSIDAALPPAPVSPQRHDTDFRLYNLPAGVIRATKARLEVHDFDETVPVQPGVCTM
jgi:hypothetical protein